MPIYTKKGDSGMTSIIDAPNIQDIRTSKSAQIIRTIGAVDEVNSYLGIVALDLVGKPKQRIISVQKDLFRIGSILAGSSLRFRQLKTTLLETDIDEMEKTLPPLKNFILPGGEAGAKLHFARTIARRLEREYVELLKVRRFQPEILQFINRLSDYLFVLARKQNFERGIKEEAWMPTKKR